LISRRHQVKFSNRFAALETLDDNVGHINRGWENIGENIKISVKESLCHFELRQQKPQLDERCSKLLDRRKHDKLQWFAQSKPNEWG
jgi:hypothetical protein